MVHKKKQESNIAENRTVDHFFSLSCVSGGPDCRSARAGADKTQFVISGLLSKIVLFCINSGSIAGPKSFQFCLQFDLRTDVNTDPSLKHHF